MIVFVHFSHSGHYSINRNQYICMWYIWYFEVYNRTWNAVIRLYH